MLTSLFRPTFLPEAGVPGGHDPCSRLVTEALPSQTDIRTFAGRPEAPTLQKICGTAANSMSFAYVFQPLDLQIDISF